MSNGWSSNVESHVRMVVLNVDSFGMTPFQERNGSGHPTVSYTRGLDLSGSLEGAGGIGGLLTRSTHATSSPYQQNSHAFYHADGNGNVTYLRRSDGAS